MKNRFSPAQTAYLVAKAKHETIKEIERECQIKVLAANEYYPDLTEWPEETERITNPNRDFLMDEENFTRYCILCHEELTKRGVRTPDYNTTADYKSRPALKKAEKALIEWGLGIAKKTPGYLAVIKDIEKLEETLTWNMEVREKFIDITLSLQA